VTTTQSLNNDAGRVRMLNIMN